MNRNTIEHDVHLTDVRLLFESMGLANDFTPEWEMKSRAMRTDRRSANDRVIPDGLIVESINGESKVIAVELERTRKSSKRYERILQQYSQKPSIDHIWYIASDLTIVDAVWKAGKRVGFQMRRLWFVKEDVLLSDKWQSRMWRAHESKAIRLNEIGFDRLKSDQPHAQPVSKDAVENAGRAIGANASKLQDEMAVVSRLRAWPTTPDPSPPTSGGKGSGVVSQENAETTGSVKLEKCG